MIKTIGLSKSKISEINSSPLYTSRSELIRSRTRLGFLMLNYNHPNLRFYDGKIKYRNGSNLYELIPLKPKEKNHKIITFNLPEIYIKKIDSLSKYIRKKGEEELKKSDYPNKTYYLLTEEQKEEMKKIKEPTKASRSSILRQFINQGKKFTIPYPENPEKTELKTTTINMPQTYLNMIKLINQNEIHLGKSGAIREYTRTGLITLPHTHPHIRWDNEKKKYAYTKNTTRKKFPKKDEKLKNLKITTIHLTTPVIDRLTSLSELTGQSKSSLTRHFTQQGIIIDQHLTNYLNGKPTTYKHNKKRYKIRKYQTILKKIINGETPSKIGIEKVSEKKNKKNKESWTPNVIKVLDKNPNNK